MYMYIRIFKNSSKDVWLLGNLANLTLIKQFSKPQPIMALKESNQGDCQLAFEYSYNCRALAYKLLHTQHSASKLAHINLHQ